MNKYIWVLPLAIFLSACAGLLPVKDAANARPDWIDNPGNGVSASAGTNVYGKIKQEETAIARARTEFAKRFGVSIEAGQVLSTNVNNGRASTESQSGSIEKMNQSDVKAMVKAKWRDEEADVLWVWLVPSN
ncbi:MAG: hypothetical protein WC825_07400 [Gallionellaceae bacterium]|jgi:hypothetical protein